MPLLIVIIIIIKNLELEVCVCRVNIFHFQAVTKTTTRGSSQTGILPGFLSWQVFSAPLNKPANVMSAVSSSASQMTIMANIAIAKWDIKLYGTN